MSQKRTPTLAEALFPIVAIALFLGVGYGVFRLSIEVLLLGASALTGLVAYRMGLSYKDLEEGIVKSIGKGMPAALIMIMVGTLVGSWIAAGTIPMLIYYGLKIISPEYFLVTACLVCSVISILTGTSYGTAGTVGVVFMGIAHSLNLPLGQAAGAIIAGAYFGDKISPFSDTTNLAPMAAGSNIYDHIKHMMWTTLPPYIIGLVIYYFLGKGHGGTTDSTQINVVMDTMQAHFKFSILLLLPPAIILYCMFTNKPTVPGMLVSSLVAVILAVALQHMPINEALTTTVKGYVSKTNVVQVDKLLSKGGMMSMMGVVLISFCAFAFAGICQKAGMLDVLLNRMLKFADSAAKLIATVVLSVVSTALLTGSSYLSILVPGELFAPAFGKMNLAAKNLSRTLEDCGTVFVPLLPWSMAGVYMSGTLGVPTTEYFSYAYMNYLGIAFALFYGLTGISIAKKIREDQTLPGS